MHNKILLNCTLCNKEYQLFPSLAKRSKYCSRLCHNRGNAEANSNRFKGENHWNTGKRFRLKPTVTIECRYCSHKVECAMWEYKGGKKYCSKECYDKHQTNRDESSKKIWIRESIALYGYDCEKCGSDALKIDVHHIDRNRKNNPEDGSNWMRLCDKCHKLIHKTMRDRAPIIGRNEFLDK
jgi:hypothetical protein